MLSPLLVFGVMLWLTESLVDWQVEMADRLLRWNRWPDKHIRLLICRHCGDEASGTRRVSSNRLVYSQIMVSSTKVIYQTSTKVIVSF